MYSLGRVTAVSGAQMTVEADQPLASLGPHWRDDQDPERRSRGGVEPSALCRSMAVPRRAASLSSTCWAKS